MKNRDRFLAGVVLLFLAVATQAAEVVIYHDENPSARGWFHPWTHFTTSRPWGGSACLAHFVSKDKGYTSDRPTEMGLRWMEVKVAEDIDWASAALVFHVDPDAQALEKCVVGLETEGRTGPGKRDSFRVELGRLGDGKPGYRPVTIPMTKFAPTRDAFVGKTGFIKNWLFTFDAKAETVIRVDEVRVVDKNWSKPPTRKRVPVTFSEKPAFRGGAVVFEVSDFCDVTVHVLNSKGKVVRHLGAGVLGEKAPAPFTPNAKKQSIPFDGKGDDGRPLPPGDYSIRVGLQLKAKFDRLLGEDPDSVTFGFPTGIQTDENGLVYVLNHAGPQRDTNHRIWVYDRNGKYVREIMPPNPNLHPSYWNATNGSKQADVTSAHNRYDTQTLNYMPGGWFHFLSVDHGFGGVYPGIRRLLRIRRDGGGFSDSKSLAFWMPLHSELMYTCVSGEDTLLISDGSLRDEIDGKFCYRPPWFAQKPEWQREQLTHTVFNCRVTPTGLSPNRTFHYAGREPLSKPREYLGTRGKRGDGPALFSGPRGVTVNARGEIMVCDSGNNKLKIYRVDGFHLRQYETYTQGTRQMKLEKPSAIAVEKSTGALYLTMNGPKPPDKGKRLVKLLERDGGLVGIWSVELNELAGCQIAVDTSTQPTLVWTLFGDGFASFTRIEDLGKRVGNMIHFGGPERWKGMLQCRNLAVDVHGNCWSGRFLRSPGESGTRTKQHSAYLYKNTPDGRLITLSLPSDQTWVAGATMFVGPENRLYVLSRGNFLKVNIDDDVIADGDIERIPFQSKLENVRYRTGLTVDEDGNLYTLALAKKPGGGKWSGISGHLQKFAPDGSELIKSCIPGLNSYFRQLAVRKNHGYWVFSGWHIFHYSLEGKKLWDVGGFRFGHHQFCGCARPGFHLDENLYAWVCDMGRIGVFVIDRAGNEVTHIGSYGNRDCRGAPSAYPLPEIPLSNPRMAVADDDTLWIQDYNHQRIVRCKLGYEVTEMVKWSP